MALVKTYDCQSRPGTCLLRPVHSLRACDSRGKALDPRDQSNLIKDVKEKNHHSESETEM